jgi:transaldolase
MKIFLDTAEYEVIKRWGATELVDGVTTNPTLLGKEQGMSPKELLLNICSAMGEKPVSVEVTEREPGAIYEQAHKIAELAENIVVKVPCRREYVTVIERLVNEGVPVNITLVFSVTQALMMAKLGVDYVSPFIGRLEDIDSNGLEVISGISEIFSTYGYETEILAASIRSVRHVHEVALRGAHIATVPPAVFDKLFEHPLTDKGLDQFLADWEKRGVERFP